MSVAFCVACALRDGVVRLERLERPNDNDMMELIRRIHVGSDPSIPENEAFVEVAAGPRKLRASATAGEILYPAWDALQASDLARRSEADVETVERMRAVLAQDTVDAHALLQSRHRVQCVSARPRSSTFVFGGSPNCRPPLTEAIAMATGWRRTPSRSRPTGVSATRPPAGSRSSRFGLPRTSRTGVGRIRKTSGSPAKNRGHAGSCPAATAGALENRDVCGLRVSRGRQQALPLPHRAGQHRRRVDGARPADPDRPRFRPPDGARRGGANRSRALIPRRRRTRIRRHPAGPRRTHLHDGQLHRPDRCRVVLGPGGEAGRRRPSTFTVQIQNDPIKEYIARGTQFLPIEASVQIGHRHAAIRQRERPELAADKRLGLAHEAGRRHRRARGRVHDLQRHSLCRGVPRQGHAHRRLRAEHRAAFLHRDGLLRGGRQVPGDPRGLGRTGARALRRHDPRGAAFRLHAATSGRPLTAQQPLNNISRITLQILAQILGGCEQTRTASFDEALGIPTEVAARTSIRANQIMPTRPGCLTSSTPSAARTTSSRSP